MLKKLISILIKYPVLIFFLFTLIAYLPVLLPFFHLKNDLITQNLPTRYVNGESIYSGYFPWWNPYINFGIPQYGDMNNGFWNPIQWLISVTTGHNLYTITAEEMFYIFIGGLGIYKVCKHTGSQRHISILTGIAYMSSGFILGHLQHFCWITGTGFFPYVLLFVLRLNRDATIKNFVLGSFSVYLFLSSTHPGIVIGSLYFGFFLLLFICATRNRFAKLFYQPKFFVINFSFFVLSAAFCVGIITSNIDVLQHISRGERVSLEQSLLHPTSLQSYISLFFPLSIVKSDFFKTDISMRNVYVGIAALAGIIIFFKAADKKLKWFSVFYLLFFVLLSAGGIFKTIFHYTLPLLGNVRLNGEFAYFVVLILLLAGTFGLNVAYHRLNSSTFFQQFINKGILVSSVVAILSLVTGFIFHTSVLFKYTSAENFTGIIKNIIDSLSFTDVLAISAAIQCLTLFLLKNKEIFSARTFLIITGNLVLFTWLILPFTGLGMISRKVMNDKMLTTERGIAIQPLKALNEMSLPDSTERKEFILTGCYRKQAGLPFEEQYPVAQRSTEDFFNDTALQQFIYKQSYVFLGTDTTTNSITGFDSTMITVKEFGAGNLLAEINAKENYTWLTFLQNHYPYWNCTVDGKEVTVFKTYKTFMSVKLPQGKHTVRFYFDPAPVRKSIVVTIVLLLAGLAALLSRRIRETRIFN